MATRPWRCPNTLQCLWTTLCQTDSQDGCEQGVGIGIESEAQDPTRVSIAKLIHSLLIQSAFEKAGIRWRFSFLFFSFFEYFALHRYPLPLWNDTESLFVLYYYYYHHHWATAGDCCYDAACDVDVVWFCFYFCFYSHGLSLIPSRVVGKASDRIACQLWYTVGLISCYYSHTL